MINQVPDALFKTRVRNDSLGGPNPFEWKELSSNDIFKDKKVALLAVPGAFTPACSDSHLPGYDTRANEFYALGIDSIICLSVNDAFVMFQWARAQNIEHVFMLPDGNGEFTRKMGMLVDRSRQGLGMRSWRYSLYIENCKILKAFVEPGFKDNPDGVPVTVSGADTMLEYLRAQQ